MGVVGLITLILCSWESTFPDVRLKSAEVLFYIERNIDARRVHYELNLDRGGDVIPDEPFKIYWVSAPGKADRKDLNMIQRRFVYGVRVQQKAPDRITFTLAAYPDLQMELKRNKGAYQVHTRINGESCVLKRIHVQLENDNVFNPTVEYVTLEGINAQGKTRRVQIKP